MTSAVCCHIKKPEDIQASYDIAIAENPANRQTSVTGRKKRAAGKHTYFWAPGRTLRIAFLNGDQSFKDAVKAAVSIWQPYVNLNFEFVGGAEGDIRIKSEAGIYWSYIGTNALTETDQSLPTMRLSPDHTLSLKFFNANTLHEFGHVLGAEHEHLHPESTIPWNRQAVYADHGVPEDADEDHDARRMVDERYFNLLDASEVAYSPYDPLSIMHYAVRQDWTEGNFKIDLNFVLSEKDKAFMAAIYPFPAQQ
ncbi:hypothetical protein PS662_01040 [Pseudomonas fluorescens]|uniref:Peptidase metallopeptidase domain-containing protein n=1 Tax=Pseudomonas fluorescens TaxID=294 RepID=A0A5E6QU95_PSEFL|nr:hypothetical protein [Pseudomonas fluorescens]VVM55785.1 hypothetical protein PS662_01040 [Pseudomonas fluorescens]